MANVTLRNTHKENKRAKAERLFTLCYSTDLFICPTKFSNSALLFGSYFDVLVCASLCFLIFARFVSTPNFRHNAQLFCFFLPSSSVQSLISFWDSKQTDVLFFVSLVTRHRYFYFVPWVNFQIYFTAVPCRSLIY